MGKTKNRIMKIIFMAMIVFFHFHVAMAQEGSITGVVTDTAGNPLEGIHVEVREYSDSGYYSGGYMGLAYTDSDGRYSFTELENGAYTLRFTDYSGSYIQEIYDNFKGENNYNPGSPVTVTSPNETSNINAQLERGGSISGRVTDASGNPIENIQINVYVEFNNYNWDNAGSASTDADGNYTVQGLSSGSYKVEFSNSYLNSEYAKEVYDNKYVSYYQGGDVVEVHAPNDTPNINAQLERGGSISGRVTDSSGNPIESVSVYILVAGDSNGNAFARGNTDANGNYSVGGLPSGNFKVEFEKYQSDYVKEVYDDRKNTGFNGNGGDAVTVLAPNATPGINAQLEIGGSVSGIVTNSYGTGIEGINVNAFIDSGSGSWWSAGYAMTDSNGHYKISGLADAMYVIDFYDDFIGYVREYYDNIQGGGFNDAHPVAVSDAGEISNINAQLELGGIISGRVTDELGNGVSNINITVYDNENNSRANGNSTADGSYTVVGVPAGTWKVKFTDYSRDRQAFVNSWYSNDLLNNEAQYITVGVSQTTPNINGSLARGGSISGVVTEISGSGISGLYVAAYDPSTMDWVKTGTVNPSGDYTVTGLPTGEYLVQFYTFGRDHDGSIWYNNQRNSDLADRVYVSAPNNTEGIDTHIDITSLTTPVEDNHGSISGYVLDEHGAVITDERISIHALPVDNSWDGLGTWVSSQDGTFTISNLPAGYYKVLANNNEVPTYTTKFSNNVTNWDAAEIIGVTANNRTEILEIRLEKIIVNAPPAIQLATGTPKVVNIGEVVTFQCQATDPEGEIVTISWDFGGGIIKSGESVTHIYGAGGSYRAKVTVQDAHGNTDSETVDIFVVSLISMEIYPKDILLTQSGATQRLLAKGILNTGSPVTPDAVEWSSSNPETARMDGDRVVAVSEGEATLTAISGSVSAQVRVRVTFLPVALDLISSLVLLEQEQVYSPAVFAVYPDATRKEVTDFTLSFKDSSDASSGVIGISGQSITGAAPGSAVITVTSGELSAEFLVNVSAPVPLNISPARFRVNPESRLTVRIDGGTPPYTSATGSISQNQWSLISPAQSGDYNYLVTDSKGQSARLEVTILEPLQILSSGGSPLSTLSLDLGESVGLTPSGGTQPYAWTITAGTITENGDGRSVTYTSPDLSGIHTVTLTDSGGQSRSVTLATVHALTTTPKILYLAPEKSRTIHILGGLAPYTAVADAGFLTDPAGGSLTYTAPQVTGAYLVTITDNRGRKRRIQVNVSLPLMVSPRQAFLRRDETRTFKLAGGIGKDDEIFITALKGDVDTHPNQHSFNYKAPDVTGQDTVLITDINGDQVKIAVEITPDHFFITPLQATLLRGESRTFRVVGGTGDEINWKAEQGDISGQNQPNTEYRAPDVLASPILSAMDVEKRETESQIHVISDQVKISPSRVYLNPGEQATFRALFGTYEYEYAWTRGKGEVEDGVLTYTAPSRPGIHYITVFDSAGNTAKAEAVVSGGGLRSRISSTTVFNVTDPDIFPNSESQPAAVGEVQEDGNTFSLALDFPNYEDDNGDPVPTNFYVGAHIPAWDLFFLFDDQGGLHELAAIQPCMAGVTDAVYTELLSFDYCSPGLPVDVNMYILAVESGYDPEGNLNLVPADAPFELWYYDFSFGKCQLNDE